MLDKLQLSNGVSSKISVMENKVLNEADLVLTVSKSWSEDFKELGAKRTEVVTNGYDIEDFRKAFDHEPEQNQISHFGLLNDFRNYPELWEALDRVLAEGTEFKLKLGGMIEQVVRDEVEARDHLGSHVEFGGYISHDQVLSEYQNSGILLLLTNQTKNSKGHLPGKFFEYIGSGKPILAIAPQDSDLAYYISQLDHAVCFDPENLDTGEISNWVKQTLSKAKKASKSPKEFDRKVLAGQVSDLLI